MQKQILFPLFAFVIGILLGVLIFPITQSSISQDALKEKIQSYFQKGYNITLNVTKIQEENGLYKVTLSLNGRSLDVFVSKDGNYLFTGFLNLSQPITTISIPQFSPPKSNVPDVKLFVMSFCPYGTQAELFLKPIYDSLKQNANFSLIFIVNVNGNNLSSVNSLHGSLEVLEDAREVCIEKNYGKDILWNYIENFVKNCYPNATQNKEVYLSCAQQQEKKLNINSTIIENCMNSNYTINTFKEFEALSQKYNVYGSPTLIINNVTYFDNFGRSTQAYQKAVCLAFLSPPSFCFQQINSSATTTTGHC
jgi:hypothetical protein